MTKAELRKHREAVAAARAAVEAIPDAGERRKARKAYAAQGIKWTDGPAPLPTPTPPVRRRRYKADALDRWAKFVYEHDRDPEEHASMDDYERRDF